MIRKSALSLFSRSGSFARSRCALFFVILNFFAVSLVQPVLADDINYLYDDVGRLIVAANSSQATRWQYDEVGNLISSVTTTANPVAPALQSISPHILPAGYPIIVTIAGQNLITTKTVTTSVANSIVSVLGLTDTQINMLLTVPSNTGSETVLFTVATFYGSASIQATITHSTLSLSPSLMALEPGYKGSITATLSPAVGEDVTVKIQNSNPAVVSTQQSIVVLSTGTTTFEATALSPGSATISAGDAAVQISSFYVGDAHSQPVSVYLPGDNAFATSPQPVSVYLPGDNAFATSLQPFSVYLPGGNTFVTSLQPVSVYIPVGNSTVVSPPASVQINSQ